MANKFFRLLLISTLIFFTQIKISFADSSYYIDFSKVLNESKAGKQAQDFLKNKFESESKKFAEKEKKLRKEESEIIAQKKLINKEEYQKKVKHKFKAFYNVKIAFSTYFTSLLILPNSA